MTDKIKTVYKYDEKTGEFLNAIQLQENPKRPGTFLLPPANCIYTAPPTAKKNQAVVVNSDKTDWEIVDDYRNYEYFLPDGSHHKIETLGIKPPADALDKQPPPTPKQQLKIDYQAWKASRADAVAKIVVEVDGMHFNGNESSQERMTRNALLATDDKETISWIMADNATAQVNAQQLKQAARLAAIEQTKLWIPPEKFRSIGHDDT